VSFFHNTYGVPVRLTVFNEDLARAVDIEVIKTRSKEASESEQTCDDFRAKLLQRDVRCVWTGASMDYGAGLHIIPYARGSEVRSTIFFERCLIVSLLFNHFSGSG
jgi:hypothetical protein